MSIFQHRSKQERNQEPATNRQILKLYTGKSAGIIKNIFNTATEKPANKRLSSLFLKYRYLL